MLDINRSLISQFSECFSGGKKKNTGVILSFIILIIILSWKMYFESSINLFSVLGIIVQKVNLFFYYQYAKLGLTLVVPGGGIKKKSPNATQDKTRGPATVGSHADEEEDEYSGGLCQLQTYVMLNIQCICDIERIQRYQIYQSFIAIVIWEC